MMHLFDADPNGQAKATKLIRVTPEALRQIAERIEVLAKSGVLPGESVAYPVAHGLTLVYQPDVTERAHKERQEMGALLEGV